VTPTERNRAHWDRIAASYQRAHARQFPIDDPAWGAWAVPERELRALGPVAGLDVLELGCGAAWWSAALALQGARVTGLDVSAGQLREARALLGDLPVTLVEADATTMPFAPAVFDLVFADHGAPTFCDPHALVPEVARVLRPGGRFVFNMTTPLLDTCWDGRRVGDRLVTPWFGLHDFPTEDEVSYQLSYGDWIRLFVQSGFAVEDLVELRPGAGATTTFENFAPVAWARRWPAEHIWKVRRAAIDSSRGEDR
jgi:SAM-dependent methyltransferase